MELEFKGNELAALTTVLDTTILRERNYGDDRSGFLLEYSAFFDTGGKYA